jgi:hypothetical protein
MDIMVRGAHDEMDHLKYRVFVTEVQNDIAAFVIVFVWVSLGCLSR